MRLPRSLSGWTMAVFGFMALVLGLVGLVAPDAQLAMVGFVSIGAEQRASGDYTRVFMTASSMASVNMGVYYVLAAAVDFRPFFFWTVPFRVVTFTVFTTLVLADVAPDSFLGVGLWEGLGALVTGAALWHERRRARPDGEAALAGR
ncbi:hypothetical protein Pth03_24560 [Planotetraspora thailandica]|uniref:Uncharacterized protein n=1 Tax=Planotetraspora thailandica TaxID=487172 RepID=A0A8J3XT84_9ACTN|nr:hypothetical protein [Planotetraspora thailandica]GII54067.1 hypothetical protein Pth03_24560 [Planotetraspora thailandica]